MMDNVLVRGRYFGIYPLRNWCNGKKHNSQPTPEKKVTPTPALAKPTAEAKGVKEVREKPPKISIVEMQKKFLSLIKETKGLIMESSKMDVDITMGRELIEEGIKKGKDKNYAEAIELLERGKDEIKVLLKRYVEEKMAECEELLKKAQEYRDLSPVEIEIKEAKNLLKSERYSDAHEKIVKCEGMLRSVIEKGEIVSELRKVTDTLKRLVNIKIRVPTDVDRLVKLAIASYKRGRTEDMKRYLREAQKILAPAIGPALDEKLSMLREPLMNAKMVGADISEIIKMMKEAKTALKMGDYLVSISNLEKIYEELRKLGIDFAM